MTRRPVDLGSVQETMLIPLYGRALETAKRRPIVRDPKAAEIVDGLDYDWVKFRRARGSLLGSVLRGEIYDAWTSEFMARHPGGTVVEIGAGLNSRYERLDNGRMHWVDIDLPDSMALRRVFFADTDRRTSVSGSIVDEAWIKIVAARPGPYLFLSEAVLLYLPEAAVKTSVGHIATHFPGSLLAMDTWSQWVIDNLHRHDSLKLMDVKPDWACADPAEIEQWGLGLTLRDSRTVVDVPASTRQRLSRPLRFALPMTKLLRRTRAYRIHLFMVTAT